MKKLIEQIKEMPGVKDVILATDDRVVVTFEAEKVIVEWKTDEHIKFIEQQRGFKTDGSRLKYIAINKESMVHHSSLADRIIPFTQYLKDYNLREEYLNYMVKEAVKRGLYCDVKYSFNDGSESTVVEPMELGSDYCLLSANGCNIILSNGEWATPIKEELVLVDGEIYYSKEFKVIFRSQTKSVLNTDGEKEYESDIWDTEEEYRNEARPATKKQKQKLIRAEVKNKYYHELNTIKG